MLEAQTPRLMLCAQRSDDRVKSGGDGHRTLRIGPGRGMMRFHRTFVDEELSVCHIMLRRRITGIFTLKIFPCISRR
jgi:hypothetical protein